MSSIKNFFAVTFGIMGGALILAPPFVAFFGLFMMGGLAFGLSLIAAGGAVTTMARKAKEAEGEPTQAEPIKDKAPPAAEAQPA